MCACVVCCLCCVCLCVVWCGGGGVVVCVSRVMVKIFRVVCGTCLSLLNCDGVTVTRYMCHSCKMSDTFSVGFLYKRLC